MQVGSSVRVVEQKPRKQEAGTRQKHGQPPQVEWEVVKGLTSWTNTTELGENYSLSPTAQ
jgi:hypothetical protein